MSRSQSRSPTRNHRGSSSRNYDSRRSAGPYERATRQRRYDDRERERSTDEQGYRQRARQGDARSDRGRDDFRFTRQERRPSPRASYRPVREQVEKVHDTYSTDRGDSNRSASPHRSDRSFWTGEKQLQSKDGGAEKKGLDVEQDDDDTEAQMAAMMGFGGFGSTKGEKVRGNEAAGAISKPAKRVEYRQYMNRAGGFNRPLDEKSAV